MFGYLNKFKKIIVTGPHRAGTRICGKMISYDLGYPFVDEEDIHFDSLYTFFHYLSSDQNLVIHCPALSRYIHNFRSDKWAIIFMKRNKKDILLSEKRIGWTWEWLEKLRYDKKKREISDLKNLFWDNYQKDTLRNKFEIKYDSLKDHPLWIGGDQRRSFSAEQFSLSNHKNIHLSNLFPVKSPGVNFAKLNKNGEGLIIGSNRNIKMLNATGVKIWQLCTGKFRYEDICNNIKDEFVDTDPGKVKKETLEFLEDLEKDRYIQILKIPVKD